MTPYWLLFAARGARDVSPVGVLIQPLSSLARGAIVSTVGELTTRGIPLSRGIYDI